MSVSTEARRAQGRHGAAVRHGTPEQIEAAARDHATAKIIDYVRRTVDNAPALTDEQRNRIAAALAPFAGGGSDAA